MILSAMIFAGLTLVIGGVLGFLLGQARARMSYEEKLEQVEASRADLKSQLTSMMELLRQQGLEPPRESKPAAADRERK